MKEPEREEESAEPSTAEQEAGPTLEVASQPKAYAFDGWGMVPLEFGPA